MVCIARANRVAIQKILPTRNLWYGHPKDAGAEPAASPKSKIIRRKSMENNAFMRVDEVAQVLSVSKSYAYKLVQKLNAELKEMGYLTISGRVSKQYFIEKTCYNEQKIKERK